MKVTNKGKVLWAVKIENNSDGVLTDCDLVLTAPGKFKFTSIDEFESNENQRIFHIDKLPAGYSKTIPIILIAPDADGVPYSINEKPAILQNTYETNAVLLAPDGTNRTAYASNIIKLNYIELLTKPLR